jgi:predicted dehydrogenase
MRSPPRPAKLLEKSDMLKYGVIGYGYWGPNLVRVLNTAKDSRVVAVADQVAANREKAAGLYPAMKITDDARELIADPAIDAIAIATPVTTHFDLAWAALDAGKHVIVEKPLCESAEKAEKLVEFAAKKQRQILVDHTFVYTGAVRKVLSYRDEGRLGRVLYYDSTRINLGLYQKDVNVIWDLAVHDFSIILQLLPGRPVGISAISSDPLQIGVEAVAQITLLYPDQVMAHVNTSWLSPVKVRQILIGGDKSMIVYDDLEPDTKIRLYDKGVEFTQDPQRQHAMKVEYRVGDMLAPQVDTREALSHMAAHANECFAANKSPLTGGAVGAKIVRLLELADLSASKRGEMLCIESW